DVSINLDTYSGATGLTTSQMNLASTYAGWSSSYWNLSDGSYPALKKPPFNSIPVANAGAAQTVDEGVTVVLGGSGSDDDGDTLTYLWSGPDGITITGHDTASASFTAPDVSEAQTFTLALQVNGGEVDSAKSFVAVTVNPAVTATDLTAKNAYAIQIDDNTNIVLDSTIGDVGLNGSVWAWYSGGVASDASNSLSVFLAGVRNAATHRMTHRDTDPGSLGQTTGSGTYQYDYTGIPGGGNDSDAKGVVLKYTATEERTLLIETTGGAYNDSVVIIFTEAHLNGGVAPFRVVTQDSGDPTTFKVKFPHFTDNPDANIYYIALTSYNSSDLGAGVPLRITSENVTSSNAAPVANAGAAQTVDEGVTVVLDGSGSDDDGDTLTYLWSGPDGITLSDATVVNPTFTAPVVNVDTDYSLSLIVNDGQIDSVESTVVVTVKKVEDSESSQNGGDAEVLGSTVVPYPYVPMTILAKLSHQNYTAVDGDTVKAYVGNELRAKGTVQIESGVPVVGLLVNVNAAVSAGETLSTVILENSNSDQYQFINKTKLVSGSIIGNAGRYLLTDGVSQTLEFNQGWNFVSMFIDRGSDAAMAPSAYFGSNYSKMEEIRTYSGVYNPSDPLNGVLSTFTKFELGAGYWVRTSSAFNNTVSGYLGGDLSVSLEEGWNMAGYPRRERRAAADIVGALKASGKLVQVISDTDLYLADDSLAHFNTLTHFDPGKGYWIKTNADATWDLNMAELVGQSGNRRGVAKSDGGLMLAQFRKDLTTYPNLPAVVFSAINAPEGGLAVGSIAGAFVNDELRGVQVVNVVEAGNSVSMVIHVNQAETVTFKLWDPITRNWQSIREALKLESGDFLGADGSLVSLTLETRLLAKQLVLSHESMRLTMPVSLRQSHKLQRSLDLREWEDVQLSVEELEKGLLIRPNQNHEFFRLIKR
ncbi:MAG: PKD domain-containing protein, partial [Planctomycetota bacterium]|nr:PKD domain-containing protein [Planctomycetota bacterium]